MLPRVLVTDPAACAAQAITDGLRLWSGTWFLDLNAGFAWLLYLGQKITNTNQLLTALHAFLSSIPGITGIVDLSATFNTVNRSFSYQYQVTFNSSVTISGGSGVPSTITGGSS